MQWDTLYWQYSSEVELIKKHLWFDIEHLKKALAKHRKNP